MKNKKIINKLFIYIFTSLTIINTAFTQVAIDLEEAWTKVKKNNPEMKILQSREAMESTLVKAVRMWAPIQISSTLGQYNSSYFDNNFSVTQEFYTPGYFRAKQDYQTQKYAASTAYRKWMEANMLYELELMFIQRGYLLEKEKIFLQQDSLFNLFLEKTALQINLGDTDIMARILAEQQKFKTGHELSLNRQSLANLELEFNKLISESGFVMKPIQFNKLQDLADLTETTRLDEHPEIAFYREENQVAVLSTKAEKATYWPTYFIGYQNTSIRGTGADNIAYSGKTRFNSVQVGIQIPLSRKSIQYQIQASRMKEDISSYQVASVLLEKETQLQKTIARYQQEIIQISNFEKSLIPGLNKLREISQISMDAGKNNFLEYTLLLNQSFELQAQYLDLLLAAKNDAAFISYQLTH